jgi:hypothetical protein
MNKALGGAAPLRQVPPLHAMLQRKCDCGSHTPAGATCRGCGAKAALQRKGIGGQRGDTADRENSAQGGVPAIVDAAVRSGGRPLDGATQSFFQSKLSHDFSGVRVHDGHTAAASARAVSSHAFTVGNNLVFAAGRYAPDTPRGKELLGHELAHVVQQRRGGARPDSAGQVASLEASADRAASAALHGSGPVSVGGAASIGLQMNAEAYVWDPHVDGFGHAAIKLCDGTYISWWPAGPANSPKEQYWSGRPGGKHDYADDIGPGGENKAPDDVYDLGCNCLDEPAIKDWYSKNFLSNPDAKWAVLKNSCSDVAHKALNVGSSVTNPCYASISHTNLFWTPKDLGAYAACQSRWCKSKAAGALNATGRYVWENVKELAGGAAINTLKSLWWKGEIVKKSLFD